MTDFRCLDCNGLSLDGLVETLLDPRWATGYCITCRRTRTFRRAESDGEARKAAGMAQAALTADQGVDAAWRSAAIDVVRVLANSGKPFTINDVTDQVGLPSHRNATGSLLPTLARQGLIRKVGFSKGTRASQHARDVALWRGAWAVEAA